MTDRLQTGHHLVRDRVYKRRPGVSVTQVEDELFLVRPGDRGRAVFHLDPIGAGLWRLFAEPHTVEEAQTVMQTAFPHVDCGRIDADVVDVVERLVDNGLMVAADDSDA